MKAVYDPGHARHDPQSYIVRGRIVASRERPERAEALLTGLEKGRHDVVAPTRHGRGPIARIHSPDYLAFLETAYVAWLDQDNPGPEVMPNIHPQARPAHYPTGIIGRAGWHMADGSSPIGRHTFAAALGSADVALTAADIVLGGERCAYALCRPPGHHAYRDMAGGFCFLNNTAIAAQHLRGAHERVAILDVDVHHGNGTQGIFYERGDVLTVSLHAETSNFYPFFWGYADERGEGPGRGANLNLPLPMGSGDQAFLGTLIEARRVIDAFAPGALVLALGLDASKDDPFAALAITTDGFRRIGATVAAFGLPTVIVQEGGYLQPSLGANLTAFLAGFESGI